MNIWAQPAWWTTTARWRPKVPDEVPHLFRSRSTPGPLITDALSVIDATHLAAALRSLDPLPNWRERAANFEHSRAIISNGKAKAIESAIAVGGWPDEVQKTLERRAHSLRLVGGSQRRPGWTPILHTLLASYVGADVRCRQSRVQAHRRLLLPVWQVLEGRLGWRVSDMALVVTDSAWIGLCPRFLEGYVEANLRRALHRALDK